MSKSQGIKASPLQNLVAVALTLLLLGALGGRAWLQHRDLQLSGPDALGASPDTLLVAWLDDIYRLGPDGELVDVMPVASLNLDGTVVDLQPLGDAAFLVGTLEDGRIRRCAYHSRECDFVGPPTKVTDGTFKFVAAQERDELYLSESGAHRILRTPLAGGAPTELSEPRVLRYPNAIHLDSDGFLWVADTNHHRLAAFSLDGGMLGEPVKEISANTDLTRSQRVWPIAFTPTSDAIWAILANGRLSHGDVVRFSPDGEAVIRATLPKGADPVDMAAMGDSIIVSDPALGALYQISDDTARAFGDRAFRAEVAPILDQRGTLQAWQTWLLAPLMLSGLGLLALTVSVLRTNLAAQGHVGRVQSGPSLARQIGVVWVEKNDDTLNQANRMAWVVLGLCAVVAALIPFVLAILPGDKALPGELIRMLGFVGVLSVIAGGGSFHMMRRIRSRDVGTDGESLYIRQSAQQAWRIPPEQLVYNGRVLAYRDIAVQRTLGKLGHVYDEEAFATQILPLLKRGRRLGEINMLIYQLMHGDKLQWSLVLLTAATLGYLGWETALW